MVNNAVNFFYYLAHGDSQISLKGVITKGFGVSGVLYPNVHLKKIIIFYFTCSTRFPYYISIYDILLLSV